jgi:hypothetical protein
MGGVERRPFRFHGLAFPRVTPPVRSRRAICVRHQCFTTIDRGSFAAYPWAASPDSAEAISASRLSPRRCRQPRAGTGTQTLALTAAIHDSYLWNGGECG